MNENFGTDKSDWEQRYFELVLELGESHSERYMAQATELIKARKIEVPIKDGIGHYALGLLDCQFLISHDDGESFVNIARTRLGWRKREKKLSLPDFFAHTEASVLIESE